ncbi:MAG TPA: DNA repair protein RecO [Gammaproteobacteria bacterium]|nr:DNA repair protein RecO [Gammaproteobacteria bacterium]
MKNSERALLTPAYVLHHHDWRETSRVVEIFSRDHGRLGAVARGARRAQSPWRALLQPFRPLLLSWTGGGELVTLIGAEADGGAEPFPGPALLSAYYMNELLLRLLPRHDAQPGLFRQYADALERLRRTAAPALRVFEKQLLSALGYGLMLERDVASDEPLQPDAVYSYELERGPVRGVSAGSAGLQIPGAALAALAREDLGQPEQLQQTRELLQVALERLLGTRPLRTRTVARALVRSTRSR